LSALFVLVAIVGPTLAPVAPGQIDLDHIFALPSAAHPFGTADNGVDILSTLLYGAQLSALIAGLSVLLSLLIGTALGILAGYRGGITDHLITGLCDLVQAFPSIVLNIAILAFTRQPSIGHVVVALSASGWVLFARLTRAQTLVLRELDFVTAVRALGGSDLRILARHIFPNLWGPLVIQASSALGMAVLAESTLSFLGLGPGREASWGALLEQGSAVLLRFPHVALIAGSAIATTVLGFNLAGDVLRDHLDPQRLS
jgi:peptide/nickel transport system permease protein